MAVDISSTGQGFYSGSWVSIQNVLRVLNIGEGKLAKVTQELVNEYQETVDRSIDDSLDVLYHTPLLMLNEVQPDGTTKQQFPGSVVRMARYWVAGLLLLNEFQNLGQNITDQAQAYVDDARRSLYSLMRPEHWLNGQVRKSNISRTLPPNMQPAQLPEANF